MLNRRLLQIHFFAASLAAVWLSAHGAGAQAIGSDGCTDEERTNAGRFGCVCVDHQPSGGFCDGSGCTDIETQNCAQFGTVCVDHQCSGGFTTGTGCTAKELTNCASVGANCVDHQCSGGFAPGNGCTAREITDCGNVGCDCNEHKCAGGFCAAASAPPPNLGPAPVVRVKGAADNDVKTLDIHTSVDDMLDDNNPNSYFESGSHMGRAIRTLANFSNDYILFGEKESGIFGHGRSVCIAPRTFVDLSAAGFDIEVPLCQGGGRGPSLPIPQPFRFLVQMTGGKCSGDSFRTVQRHFVGNFADQLMSYVGVSDREYCEGPAGVVLINRGMEGTTDLDHP